MARQPATGRHNRLSPKKMLQNLKKGRIAPVYLFYGEERYLVRKAINILKGRILATDDLKELLYTCLYASETDGEAVNNIAKSMPFFGQSQLVLLYEAEKLKEKDQKIIQAYIAEPAPFTSLVFVAGENVPKGALYSTIKKQFPNNCFGFSKLNYTERQKWLEQIASEKGLPPGLKGNFLRELLSTGHQLEALETQLEIVSLYLHDQKDKDISGPLPFGPAEISFRQSYLLTDALMKKNIRDTLKMLNHFIAFGVPPLLILDRISWQIRAIWVLKEGLEQGKDIDELLKAARIPVFKKGVYHPLSRRISWKSLRLMYSYLTETDRSLKSSHLNPHWHLENLCLGIIRLLA